MDINMIFFLTLIFISIINLLGGNEALLCSLLFIIGVYYKGKDKKTVLILLILTIILFVNYSFRTMTNIEINKTYEFQIDIISDRGKLIKVDDRYLKNSYFPILDIALEDGSYSILGKVEEIDGNLINIDLIKYEKLENPVQNRLNNQVNHMILSFPYEFQNFTKAVLLGRKDVISTEIKDKFNYTGTSHILVISGLHIGIIIVTILFLLKTFPYQIRYAFAGIILTIYCYGVGFTPSVMRAYIMGIIFLAAKIFYEEREMTKALIVAFIVSSFINPYAIRRISYQMSYLALIGIIFLYPKIDKYLGKLFPKKFNKYNIITFLILSFSIQTILIPIFLYYFRVLPLFSFLPNLIVIPLGSLLVQLLFIALLLSFIGLDVIIISFGAYLYNFLIFIIDLFYKVPFLTLSFYTKISLLLYIFLYVIILLFIILKKETIRSSWYIVFFIVPLIFLNSFQTKEDIDFEWGHYRGVPNKVLIINKTLKTKDIFFLKDSGVKKLDYLLIPYEINNLDFKRAYPNIEKIILSVDEGIKLEKELFINKKGRIILKSDINN